MSGKILIVEDNEKLAEYIKRYLEDLDYEVELEDQGDRAVYRIVREKPDLVILDVMLPNMNGKQVCKTVRKDYTGKILMLTALRGIESEVEGLNLGADDYVGKPVDPEILKARVAALLRRKEVVLVDDFIVMDSLKIDLIKHIVFLDGERIALKPGEFELLVLLAKNADCILSRENISQALRGLSYNGVDRRIDLRISYLRKKLGDNLEKPFRIKTVHGKGYVLIAKSWE